MRMVWLEGGEDIEKPDGGVEGISYSAEGRHRSAEVRLPTHASL